MYNVTFSPELTEIPVDSNVEAETVTNESPAIIISPVLSVNVEFAIVPLDDETEIGLQLLSLNSVSFTRKLLELRTYTVLEPAWSSNLQLLITPFAPSQRIASPLTLSADVESAPLALPPLKRISFKITPSERMSNILESPNASITKL